MTKVLLAVFALVAGAVTCLAGGWLGAAALGWIEIHRHVVALTQPWLFPVILLLVVIVARMRQRVRA